MVKCFKIQIVDFMNFLFGAKNFLSNPKFLADYPLICYASGCGCDLVGLCLEACAVSDC